MDSETSSASSTHIHADPPDELQLHHDPSTDAFRSNSALDIAPAHSRSATVSSEAHPLVSDSDNDDDDEDDDDKSSPPPDLQQSIDLTPPPPPREENDSDSDDVPQSLIVGFDRPYPNISTQRFTSSLSPPPRSTSPPQASAPSILNRQSPQHQSPEAKLNVRIQESPVHSPFRRTTQPVSFVPQRQTFTTFEPRQQHLPLPNSMPRHPGPSNFISDNVGNAYNTIRNTTATYIAGRPRINLTAIDPKERALWKWTNVEHLDSFLREIYDYYLGNGFYCILLSRALNMATILFVVSFSTYLSTCIDYSKIRSSSRLEDVQYPQCASRLSGFTTFLLWLFSLFWFIKLTQYVHDIRRLADLKNFYYHLLEISEAEMQTISWQQVVKRLMLLRDKNPTTSSKANSKYANVFLGSQSKKRMDPHDVANRIMRKENYMIAMINKNIIDITLPIPFYRETFLTRTLEWNLSLCIMDFVFQNGEIRSAFLKETNRHKLVDALRRRFILAGFTNIICAPITVVYMTLLYFFRYFNEYHKDPSAIGTRQYTPLAEWKMREFNELHHMFQKRLHMSYDPASRYVNQFPKEKTVLACRFVIFLAGSFAAVLGIISLIDPEIFLGFEITKDRTVLFYIGLFGSILAVARGIIPDETFVFDPETGLRQVAEYTHYLPEEWTGRYHTDEVKEEFAKLYDLRIMIIARELLSVIFMPFILWFSLPKSSEKIIDFFREFSIHIEGLGYVCSFATFDFSLDNGKRNKRFQKQPPPLQQRQQFAYDEDDEIDLRNDYFSTADGKMLKSYLNFLDNYGEGRDQSGLSVSHMANSRAQWGNAPGFSQRNGTFGGGDSFYSTAGDLENSVMGRYTRIQQTSGANTPLNRSGVIDPTTLAFGVPGALTSAFERNQRRSHSPSVHGHHHTLRKKTAKMRSFSADPSRTGTSLRYEITPEEESLKFSRHELKKQDPPPRKPKDEDDPVEQEYMFDEEDEAEMNNSYVLNTYNKKVIRGPAAGSSSSSSDEDERKPNAGVLGFLNQFYQQNDVTKF